MDGLVEKLLRLESAKHKALVEIDASGRRQRSRSSMRLLAFPKAPLTKPPVFDVFSLSLS